ncbi:amidase signature enzyme [Phlegmacium glaucopus]|nr:amidase signature enzyme [Phlegmacium glaucopus]
MNDLTCERSLMGVPVSIKDTVDIEGYDSTIGYSRNIGRPWATSSSIVRLLQDAGALIHVKTTVTTGLLAIETVSDIFGYTTNPYNPNHTVGASTGGGGARSRPSTRLYSLRSLQVLQRRCQDCLFSI